MARLNWNEREKLLLEAIRDREDGGQLENSELTAATGLAEKDVARGLLALREAGYVVGQNQRHKGIAHDGAELWAIRLAPEGRVLVGQWPTADPAAALLAALDAANADAAPEEQSAIDTARRGVRGLSTKLLTEIAVGYGKQLAGL